MNEIRRLRINKGLSARALAKLAGLSSASVWQIETRGSGSPATLKKIADALGVQVTDLLDKH